MRDRLPAAPSYGGAITSSRVSYLWSKYEANSWAGERLYFDKVICEPAGAVTLSSSSNLFAWWACRACRRAENESDGSKDIVAVVGAAHVQGMKRMWDFASLGDLNEVIFWSVSNVSLRETRRAIVIRPIAMYLVSMVSARILQKSRALSLLFHDWHSNRQLPVIYQCWWWYFWFFLTKKTLIYLGWKLVQGFYFSWKNV